MIIRKLQKKHAKDVTRLVRDTFSEFVASSFSGKGSIDFLSQITEENISRFSEERDGYVAISDSSVVGVIMSSQKKITCLFVDKRFQKKGIAAALTRKVETLFKKRGLKSITCRSSLYAVPFYEKMGFKKTRGIVRHKLGFTYQPMKKELP
ncbi:MAG: GNAT family N-acetyltransferase [archaeon]